MNRLNSFDNADWEYSLAPTDDLLDSADQRSKVKVTPDIAVFVLKRDIKRQLANRTKLSIQ